MIQEHKEELHPQIRIMNSKKKKEVVATYTLTVGAILMPGLEDGKEVAAGQILARLPRLRLRSTSPFRPCHYTMSPIPRASNPGCDGLMVLGS